MLRDKNEFWLAYEKELRESMRRDPSSYGIVGDDIIPAAAKITEKLRAAGLASCNVDSRTFRAVYKLLPGTEGTRFSRGRLLSGYAALGDDINAD